MPPEPLPWDRKDFAFKDRKHERTPAAGDALASPAAFGGGGGNSAPRWRDPYHFPRASPRRPPPSYHRLNGSYYPPYDEASGHGCTPSRSDEGFRSSNGRYNGGRSSSRDSRGSFRRVPYYDNNYLPSHATAQRSVAVPITSPPPLPPQLKDVQDKNSGGADDQRLDPDRDIDSSLGQLGWKPLKWSRQGTISSSKAVRSEVEESASVTLEASAPNLGKETPMRSPVSSPAPLDDGVPKKKPRLTWGQGLAKYEKQKVEGSSNSGKDQVSESSPKVTGMAGSTSPATPCSAACSSPGVEDRPFGKGTNIDIDTSHHSETSAPGLQDRSQENPSKLDQFLPLSKLSSLLNDLLQPEDLYTGDSTFTRNTAMNKLLSFKADISKELEKTECEIDLLENELKTPNTGAIDPNQTYLEAEAVISSEPCLEQTDSFSSKILLESTQFISSDTAAAEEDIVPISSSVEHMLEVGNTDNNILQTASSSDGGSVPSGNKEPGPPDIREDVVARNTSENSNSDHVVGESSHVNVGLEMASSGKWEKWGAIMAKNRDLAQRAFQALENEQPQFDFWKSDKIFSCRKNDVHVIKQIALRRNHLKFRERALTLKFRAFHHLWKEDLRLLSLRKQRSKSQKRTESSSRISLSSSVKHRTSIRSRFTFPAGNTTLVPTVDIVDFTSRLLSDSQIQLYRKDLKMPALILDENSRRRSRFVTKANLIEDPLSFEEDRSMINPWTQDEKRVFMEMLATFGKDFSRISSFLSHKTTADCIEFYYKNHKSESFRDVKKQLDLRKQWRCLSTNTTYLVSYGKKWNREANAISPDALGALPGAVVNATSRSHPKYPGKSVVPVYHMLKASQGVYNSVEGANGIEISGNDKEPTGTDGLAGVHGSFSSEVVSSCITSSVSPPEKMNFVRVDRPLTPEVTQTIDEDTCSDEGCGELGSVDWTDDEKSMFIRSLSLYGKDFARISEFIGTKSRDQCKIFFSKARKCLSLDQIHAGARNDSTPLSDANGGRSDTDDVCAAEMDSAICSTPSCSRTDVEFTESLEDSGVEGSLHVGSTSLQTETETSNKQYYEGASNKEYIDVKDDGLESLLIEKLETVGECPQPSVVEGNVTLKDCKLAPGHNGTESKNGSELGEVVGSGGRRAYKLETLECDQTLSLEVDIKNSELAPSHDETESKIGSQLGEGVEAGGLRRVDNGESGSLKGAWIALGAEGEQQKSVVSVKVQKEHISEGKPLVDGLKSAVKFEQVATVSENDYGKKRKIDSDKTAGSNSRSVAESVCKESGYEKIPKANACPKRVFNFSTHLDPMPRELLSYSRAKPHMTLKQDRAFSLPLSTMLVDPSSIGSEGSFGIPSQSTISFNGNLHKPRQGPDTKDSFQKCMSRINLNHRDQSSCVLSGFPVQVLDQQESKRVTEVINEKPTLRGSHSAENLRSQLNQYFTADILSEKQNVSIASESRLGMFLQKMEEDTSDSKLRPCSSNSCQEMEELSVKRTGDVKLFGQILNNACQQKSKSSSVETDSQPVTTKHLRPARAKMTSTRAGNNHSVYTSGSECIVQANLEDVPLVRSFGYWDGKHIQTGFSSLPESAMAAYQGHVPGANFLLTKDNGVSSNVAGHAVSYQQGYVPSLSANEKRLDSFSEAQKRSGFELVSGFQQGGRTAIARLGGGNMAGGSRGIMVGSGSGVSDPVAALRMATFYSTEAEAWRRDLNGR